MSNEKTLLSPEDAVKLLDLLCSDDAFREAFAANPGSAMQQISTEAGYSSESCAPVATLAGKEEFQGVRDLLLEHLATLPAFRIPHCFLSGQVEDSVQRKRTL